MKKPARKAARKKRQLGSLRHPKKRAFLAALRHTGNVSEAARAARCDRDCYYLWRRDDEAFRVAAESAMEEASDRLEQEARRRAETGVLEPVFHGGKKVGSIRRYSDTLLIFLLKGARPEKFRDRMEHSGPGGGPLVAPTLSVTVKAPAP
jgi:hypothetical protein